MNIFFNIPQVANSQNTPAVGHTYEPRTCTGLKSDPLATYGIRALKRNSSLAHGHDHETSTFATSRSWSRSQVTSLVH